MDKIIKFQKPVKIGDKTIKEIKMREPKVKDMRLVSHIENEAERELEMVANLTGLTPEELDEFPIQSYKEIQKALMDFL